MIKKVIFVCPTGELNTGGEISNFELIKYLKKHNIKVHVITAREGIYNEVLTENNIDNSVGNYSWWNPDSGYSGKNIEAINLIIDKINIIKPDAVITNTLNVPWGALASAMTNTPHIWIDREFPVDEFTYLTEKIDFIKKFSNTVTANSVQLSEFVSNQYDFPVDSFYSYVNVDDIKTGKNLGAARIVSPNGLVQRKNQKELLQALVILKNKYPKFNTKTVFIGHENESYRKELDNFILENKLEGLVEFVNFLDKPWSIVGKNDIMVQTSLSESIGRTTTEAMKLGIPVIVSNIPGHKEALNLGGGISYESGNPDDLAEKIHKAINNPKTTRKIALDAQKKALVSLSEDACNEPFMKTLGRVIGKDNPMKELLQIEPYWAAYVKNNENELRLKTSEIERITYEYIPKKELDNLKKEMNNIKKSKSYKLARSGSKSYNKIKELFKGKI